MTNEPKAKSGFTSPLRAGLEKHGWSGRGCRLCAPRAPRAPCALRALRAPLDLAPSVAPLSVDTLIGVQEGGREPRRQGGKKGIKQGRKEAGRKEAEARKGNERTGASNRAGKEPGLGGGPGGRISGLKIGSLIY